MSGKANKRKEPEKPKETVPKTTKAAAKSGSDKSKKKKKINSNLAQLFAPNLEEDKESYSADGQNASDSFDSDFFDPESEEGKDEGEFDMEAYLKFRKQEMAKEQDSEEDESDEVEIKPKEKSIKKEEVPKSSDKPIRYIYSISKHHIS